MLLVALTLAQVVTVAALARATYLAFFRRRDDDYDRIERPSVGMVVAFLVLGGGCLAFGALPGLVLDHVVRPAAASMTAGGAYARAVLSYGGRLSPEAVFDYLGPMQLLVTVGTLLLGLLLAARVVRHPGPWVVRPLQACTPAA